MLQSPDHQYTLRWQMYTMIKEMYSLLWSRGVLCLSVLVFEMLAIAAEMTLSVMSFNVGTTLLVQAACPLDNSTDTQAASVYKHPRIASWWLPPPGGAGTSVLGLGSRTGPHRHRVVVEVQWRGARWLVGWLVGNKGRTVVQCVKKQ